MKVSLNSFQDRLDNITSLAEARHLSELLNAWYDVCLDERQDRFHYCLEGLCGRGPEAETEMNETLTEMDAHTARIWTMIYLIRDLLDAAQADMAA
jgi:hypothetical protein